MGEKYCRDALLTPHKATSILRRFKGYGYASKAAAR